MKSEYLGGDRIMIKSPSSRRAWIEIIGDYFGLPTQVVALLAEGVD